MNSIVSANDKYVDQCSGEVKRIIETTALVERLQYANR